MTEVINLDDKRKEWCNDFVKCEHCNYTWMAVYPISCDEVQNE